MQKIFLVWRTNLDDYILDLWFILLQQCILRLTIETANEQASHRLTSRESWPGSIPVSSCDILGKSLNFSSLTELEVVTVCKSQCCLRVQSKAWDLA